MTLSTTNFGPVWVDESEAIEFPQGLPGFEECRRFAPLEHPAQPGLIFLQSMERPEVCFIALPVRAVRPDYRLAMNAEDRALLGLGEGRQPEIGRDVAALAILSFAPGERPTANLLSPVVIDRATGRAVQAIRPDDRYGCQEALLTERAACS